MISLESYSFWRYESSVKKLMLVTICLFEYIYFLYYHPVNLDTINMSEIFHTTKQNKYLILIKDEKRCRYRLHQELLT